MQTYTVTGHIAASIVLGTYEAKNKKAAIAMAEEDTNANWNPSICHQCSRDIEIGDIYKLDVDEI